MASGSVTSAAGLGWSVRREIGPGIEESKEGLRLAKLITVFALARASPLDVFIGPVGLKRGR